MQPFVDADWVLDRLAGSDPPVCADVRWYLDGRSGRQAYLAGHLPGAVFIDLDADLAAPATPGTGRHPLPTPAAFAAAMTAAGIDGTRPVIGYDDAGGTIAARLVWMLRAVGVAAAVLDGGIDTWPGPLQSGAPTPAPPTGRFPETAWPEDLLADIEETTTPGTVLLDARPADRYAGVNETIDPRPGHIPGARSLPCRDNLGTDGTLLPPAALREHLTDVAVDSPAVSSGRVVSSCGSGVTACHTLLVIEHLGLGRARLYPGSWSQYAGTDRPAALGAEPGSPQSS